MQTKMRVDLQAFFQFRVMRDLPIPASPEMSTTWPRQPFARANGAAQVDLRRGQSAAKRRFVQARPVGERAADAILAYCTACDAFELNRAEVADIREIADQPARARAI